MCFEGASAMPVVTIPWGWFVPWETVTRTCSAFFHLVFSMMARAFVWGIIQAVRQCLCRCLFPEYLSHFQLHKQAEHNCHKMRVWVLHLLRDSLLLLQSLLKQTLLLLEPQVSLENMHFLSLYKQLKDANNFECFLHLLCIVMEWGPHLLIHAGYTVSMSPSLEVVLSDGWTSKHSVEIHGVITGGYKLQMIIVIFIYAVWGHCVALALRGGHQDKFPGCEAEETKEKTAIIFADIKSGEKFYVYYQLNDVVQSTAWSHARSKMYQFFSAQVWSYCFSECLLVYVFTKKHCGECRCQVIWLIIYYTFSWLNFPRFWRTTCSGLLKVSWAFPSFSTYS